MPVIDLKADLSTNDLLKVVEQLDTSELESFIYNVLLIKAGRKNIQKVKKEANLLSIIHHHFTKEEEVRFNELIGKRAENNISAEELTELIDWTNYSEQIAAERAKSLYELSLLRQVPVKDLMKILKIYPRNHE